MTSLMWDNTIFVCFLFFTSLHQPQICALFVQSYPVYIGNMKSKSQIILPTGSFCANFRACLSSKETHLWRDAQITRLMTLARINSTVGISEECPRHHYRSPFPPPSCCVVSVELSFTFHSLIPSFPRTHPVY